MERTMDIHQLGAWGEFLGGIGGLIAALGVIATLIYLARQIQQNTNLVRSQITTGLVVSANEKLLNVVANPDLRMSAAKATGMTEDGLVDGFLMASIFREFELQFTVLRPQGLLDPAYEAMYDSVVPIWLGSDQSRRWWASSKPTYNPGFTRHVDQILAKDQG